MPYEEVTYDREKLYKEVWSTPMSQLASRYGLSDVGLAKICKKLKIPRPERGYWAKVRAGVSVGQRPKLPSGPDGMQELIRSKWVVDADPLDAESAAWVESHLNAEEHPKNRIAVRKRLSSPHPLVEQSEKLLTGKVEYHWDNPRSWRYLAIDVSKPLLPRALRIMDAVVKALEERGFTVKLRQQDREGRKWETRAEALGESIEIRLRERYKQIRNGGDVYPRVELRRTGILELLYGYSYSGTGCRDGKKPLEEQLNTFMIKLIRQVAKRRGQSIRWRRERKMEEEQRRIREEQERRRQEELKQRAALEQDAENWHKSQKLRAYINAVEHFVTDQMGPIKEGGDYDRWLTWARAHADRLDPLMNVAE